LLLVDVSVDAMMKRFDVVVIGGGHAGAEAAHSAARVGAETALVSMRLDALGRMSCNPAIGGLGKGQLVREVDALGGLMGLAIDRAGIQFRMLNKRKGPAVWAPRAQADRAAYAAAVGEMLAEQGRIELIEGVVEDVLTRGSASADERGQVTGVLLADGRRLMTRAVVVTTGTFMRALMHCGADRRPGGRVGEGNATGLSGCLERLGLKLGRLKTGTPQRVHRDSVRFDGLERQPGDAEPVPFSFVSDSVTDDQVPCWITHTKERTHEIISANLHRAPMYSGQIKAQGPRYCPSIEDKVVRFADRHRHQIFLEPEGRDDERIYCNGISTSLPAEVQEELVRTIAGLEEAEILQAGYAVEYDFVPTHQTLCTLETKAVGGLYLAGQINGTSGYEEAAAQGLMAGLNAARSVAGLEAVVLRRDQAYIGVMIDDLITKPPTEPYRMFTSRAEYRLQLRSDNADQRLTPMGRAWGLVGDARWETYQAKRSAVDGLEAAVVGARIDGQRAADWLRRSDVTMERFVSWLRGEGIAGDGMLRREVVEQVYVRAKYAGYIDRQQRQIGRLAHMDSIRIPGGMDFSAMEALRREARDHLERIRPTTLGQAARMTGITAADVTVLWVAIHRRRAGSRSAVSSGCGFGTATA